VPGSRPQGVITTGTLQPLVYLHRQPPGGRAVIVGAEHVSFSALLTLAHAGAEAVAMVTELSRRESFAGVHVATALRFRGPLLTRTTLTAIRGRRRVEPVELTRLDTGERQEVARDLVVFTGDWIPDHELTALVGAALDPGTREPSFPAKCVSRVGRGHTADQASQTSLADLVLRPGVIVGSEPGGEDALDLAGEHVVREPHGEAPVTDRACHPVCRPGAHVTGGEYSWTDRLEEVRLAVLQRPR
jgi:hypothetical protein